jgi:hypothetical protein
MAGFAFMLFDPRRAQAKGGSGLFELYGAIAIAISGTAIYLLRAHHLHQWPYTPAAQLQSSGASPKDDLSS